MLWFKPAAAQNPWYDITNLSRSSA